MNKILVILLLINVLSACSAQNTIPAPAGTKESNQSQNEIGRASCRERV